MIESRSKETVLVLFEIVGLCVQEDKIAASIANKMIVFLIKGFQLVNICAFKKIGCKDTTIF
jgi:hypothetical protein